MNSTFVEFVDRAFSRKGFATFGFASLINIFLYSIFEIMPGIIKNWHEETGSDAIAWLLLGCFATLAWSLLIYFCFTFLRFESFNYTHYPLIFNRKTRIVHVFLPHQKGKILSIPWGEIFFNTSRKEGNPEFFIFGNKLAENGYTVLDTFAMPTHSEHGSEYRFLQWEFIRQYMEGDDQKVAELARMVIETAGVNGRRETPFESFRQAWAAFAGRNLHFAVLFSPLIIMATIGRQFAMWTSKKPRWPAEIMDTCQFSPDDPNIRDSEHLAPRHGAPLPDVRPYAGK